MRHLIKSFLSVLGITTATMVINRKPVANASGKQSDPQLQPPNAENSVTARVWQARDSQGNLTTPETVMQGKESPSGAPILYPPRVGHASVEAKATNQYMYASFWPKDGAGKTKTVKKPGIKTPVASENNTSLAVDEASERGKATTEETFYTLDQKAVRAEFEKMLKKRPDYVMKRAKTLTHLFAQYNSENCTTAAYRLLKAGGINQLSPTCAALDSKWLAMSPNDLQACIKAAKQKELAMHPQTASFRPNNGGSN